MKAMKKLLDAYNFIETWHYDAGDVLFQWERKKVKTEDIKLFLEKFIKESREMRNELWKFFHSDYR